MKTTKYFTALILPFIMSNAFADNFVVLDGPGLCAWYKQTDGCYQRVLEAIQPASMAPSLIDNKRSSCDLPSGAKITASRSLEWMFTGDLFDPRLNRDWNLQFSDINGKASFNLQQVAQDGSYFTFVGQTPSGRSVRASFATIKNGDTGIMGTAKCDMYDSKGYTVYFFPWESWYSAKSICPDVFANGGRIPQLSIKRTSWGSKTDVVPYINGPEAEHSLFICRNYY